MAKFISFTSRKKTAAGESSEIVFVNIDLVSVARYRPDGSLSLAVHNTRDATNKIEEYILTGEEAEAAMKVLQGAK